MTTNFSFAHTFTFEPLDKPCDTGVVPSSPRFLPSIFIAHRVQQSHCTSMFHRVLLTHALALSASKFVHKFVHEKKSQRIYTSMHSAGLELTKLACTRLEDNLIRHRGDRPKDSFYIMTNFTYTQPKHLRTVLHDSWQPLLPIPSRKINFSLEAFYVSEVSYRAVIYFSSSFCKKMTTSTYINTLVSCNTKPKKNKKNDIIW